MNKSGAFIGAVRIVFAVLLLLAASGCIGKVITVDLKKYPGPVMIGPVMRIGDEARPGTMGPAFATFSGKQSQSIVASRNQYIQGDYLVTETRTSAFRAGDIGFNITLSALFRTDLLVVVDELEAGNWWHVSFMAANEDWIKMSGRLYDPKAIEWRKLK